jgi:hypothetical protein
VASKIGRTSSPLLVVELVLLKNAPTVSPAHPFTLRSPGSMMPAMLIPAAKMYWSAVPRGQRPAPTVDEPDAQICPLEKSWHCTLFTSKMLTAPAKSLNPGRFGFASAVDAILLSATATRATPIKMR